MAIGSISDFRASFNKELARPNRFNVLITLPRILGSNSGKFTVYRCEAAQLPGRTLATADQRIYGPTEKYPYQTTYEDLELTFIVTSDMVEKYLFDSWIEKINPSSTNNFEYKYDYSTTITVNQYDSTDELVYSADFIEAYPIAINQLDLDWSQNDSYHKLTVVFAYTRWFNRTET